MGGLPQAQYSVHSSANPSASGIKYDPLRYGLKPGKYRVKHFGHSTQWRTREAMACVGELLRGKLAACAHLSGDRLSLADKRCSCVRVVPIWQCKPRLARRFREGCTPDVNHVVSVIDHNVAHPLA